VKQNALHLYASGLVDLFLAHQNDQRDLAEWQREPWYKQSVKYSVSYKEIKAGFVLNELVKQQTFRLGDYCWYWIADEDLDFTHLNVGRYLDLATASGASIVQPAVAFDSHGIPVNDVLMAYTDPVELPNRSLSRSLYRYSEFVEARSPMFTYEALAVAWKLYLPGLGNSAGMELLWCRFVATQLKRSIEWNCAIIDAEQMYKLPNIPTENWENSLAVEEVLVSQHPEHRQRTTDEAGQLEDLHQWCRTEDETLVRLRLKGRHYEAGMMLKAFLHCKQYSLQAVCNIDLRVIVTAFLWILLEALLVMSIPVLLWYVFQSLWSRAAEKDLHFSRRVRIPYRHLMLSEAN